MWRRQWVHQAIRTVFPQSSTQICIVHQIRNSYRYVVWKDKKEFTLDMKDIYTAPTRQASQAALQALRANGANRATLITYR
jgi:putative transposase